MNRNRSNFVKRHSFCDRMFHTQASRFQMFPNDEMLTQATMFISWHVHLATCCAWTKIDWTHLTCLTLMPSSSAEVLHRKDQKGTQTLQRQQSSRQIKHCLCWCLEKLWVIKIAGSFAQICHNASSHCLQRSLRQEAKEEHDWSPSAWMHNTQLVCWTLITRCSAPAKSLHFVLVFTCLI